MRYTRATFTYYSKLGRVGVFKAYEPTLNKWERLDLMHLQGFARVAMLPSSTVTSDSPAPETRHSRRARLSLIGA